MTTAKKPDLSEFLKLSQRSKRKPCRVRPAIDNLSPEDRETFDAACREDVGIISNQGIAEWLEIHCGDAWQGTWQHVLPHRQGKCACA